MMMMRILKLFEAILMTLTTTTAICEAILELFVKLRLAEEILQLFQDLREPPPAPES